MTGSHKVLGGLLIFVAVLILLMTTLNQFGLVEDETNSRKATTSLGAPVNNDPPGWSSVTMGDTFEEVLGLMGEPSTVRLQDTGGYEYTRWTWSGGKYVVRFENGRVYDKSGD
jgi:hypothetical protein